VIRDQPIYNSRKSISQHLGKDFETTINEANGSKVSHFSSIILFWDQSNDRKIKSINVHIRIFFYCIAT
jgi:hypothetical protein